MCCRLVDGGHVTDIGASHDGVCKGCITAERKEKTKEKRNKIKIDVLLAVILEHKRL